MADLDPYSGWDDSVDVEVGAGVDDDATWGEAHDDAHGHHDDYPTGPHDSELDDAGSLHTEPSGLLSDPSAAESTQFDGISMDGGELHSGDMDGGDSGLIDDGGFPGHQAGGLDWDAGHDADWAGGAPDTGWSGE